MRAPASVELHGPLLRETATEKDEAAVGRLLTATGVFHPDEVEVGRELVRERLTKGPASGYEFLFVDNEETGELDGYLCWGLDVMTFGSAVLYWIAVRPGIQGRGLGHALLAALTARLAVEGARGLWAETSSTPAYDLTRRFYERTGFSLVAQHPEYYGPGDSKCVYLLPLGKP